MVHRLDVGQYPAAFQGFWPLLKFCTSDLREARASVYIIMAGLLQRPSGTVWTVKDALKCCSSLFDYHAPDLLDDFSDVQTIWLETPLSNERCVHLKQHWTVNAVLKHDCFSYTERAMFKRRT